MTSAASEPNHHQYHHHQHRPSMPAMPRSNSNPVLDRERDVHGLRMALGSILSPKRLPSSRASSGTASPCPPHFSPGLLAAHSYQHSHTPHEPSHLHTPLDVENDGHRPDDEVAMGGDNAQVAGHDGHISRPTLMLRSHSSSSVHSHEDHTNSDIAHVPNVPAIMTTTNVHSIPPAQAQKQAKKLKKKEEEARNEGGDGTMRGYIATLQSKRAWDALIHGSMT